MSDISRPERYKFSTDELMEMVDLFNVSPQGQKAIRDILDRESPPPSSPLFRYYNDRSKVAALENEFAKKMGVRYALGVNSGTSALIAACWRPDRYARERKAGELFCGQNYRMSEMAGAIGLAQLRKLDSVNESTRKIFHQLRREIELPKCARWIEPNDLRLPVGCRIGYHGTGSQGHYGKYRFGRHRRRRNPRCSRLALLLVLGAYPWPEDSYPGRMPIQMSACRQIAELLRGYVPADQRIHDADSVHCHSADGYARMGIGLR